MEMIPTVSCWNSECIDVQKTVLWMSQSWKVTASWNYLPQVLLRYWRHWLLLFTCSWPLSRMAEMRFCQCLKEKKNKKSLFEKQPYLCFQSDVICTIINAIDSRFYGFVWGGCLRTIRTMSTQLCWLKQSWETHNGWFWLWKFREGLKEWTKKRRQSHEGFFFCRVLNKITEWLCYGYVLVHQVPHEPLPLSAAVRPFTKDPAVVRNIDDEKQSCVNLRWPFC